MPIKEYEKRVKRIQAPLKKEIIKLKAKLAEWEHKEDDEMLGLLNL